MKIKKNYQDRCLSSEAIKKLSILNPWKSLTDIAFIWLQIWGIFSLAYYLKNWVWYLVLIPLIGSRLYALFIIGHDGIHGRILKNRTWNNLINDLFIFMPFWSITRLNGQNHLMHHEHLSTQDDPDRHKYGCFNKYNKKKLVSYLCGQSFFKSMENIFSSGERKLKTYKLKEFASLLFIQIFLFSSLTFLFGFGGYFLFWILPIFLFVFLTDNLRSFCEHSHPESDILADEHRLIIYTPNIFERIFISPKNMNFHAIHHLWISIPYYNLQKTYNLLGKNPDWNVENRKSYIGYLCKYWSLSPITNCQKQKEGT